MLFQVCGLSSCEEAENLFVAADKYGMTDLKGLCEKVRPAGLLNWAYIVNKYSILSPQVLSNSLTPLNAASVLLLAHRHTAPELKERTMEFVRDHMGAVSKTETWTVDVARWDMDSQYVLHTYV